MKKNALKIVAAIIGVAGAYFIYRYIKGNKNSSNESPKKKDYSIDVPPPEKISEVQFNVGTDKFPLGKGSKGNNVKLLQQALMGLKVDGIFGSLTEAALVKATGKNTIVSLNEIKAVAQKNGLGFVMTSNGIGKFVPKSQVPVIQKSPDFTPDIFK
jgi:hypothetical protein